MFDVFVSYRTVDARFGAASAHESLARRFGEDRVFLDHVSMDAGEAYPAGIRTALEQVRVLVVLIGPEWLSVEPDTGVRLIDRQGDWVRREIRRALERQIAIIPVLLLDGISLPSSEVLPNDIRELVVLQAVEVRHRSLGADLVQLGDAVARWISDQNRSADQSRRQRGDRLPKESLSDRDRRALEELERYRWRRRPWRRVADCDPLILGVHPAIPLPSAATLADIVSSETRVQIVFEWVRQLGRDFKRARDPARAGVLLVLGLPAVVGLIVASDELKWWYVPPLLSMTYYLARTLFYGVRWHRLRSTQRRHGMGSRAVRKPLSDDFYSSLPIWVERDAAEDLRSWLKQARMDGGFVQIVGESAVGKPG